MVDNSIHKKQISVGDTLICEEHNEKLNVFSYKDKLFVKFSFDKDLTLLTDKIIAANNLLKL